MFSQAEIEVVVKSGNVNVVDKMIVSGYDVKVGQNSICQSLSFIVLPFCNLPTLPICFL